MDLMVYLNGDIIKASDAKVSIYDRGYLYGDGAFETLRSYKRYVFKFQEHIQRLYNSLNELEIELPLPPSRILKAIELLLQYNSLEDAYIRISVTRGEGPVGLSTELCVKPTILVLVEPLHTYPQEWYLQGVPIILSPYRKIPDVCLPSRIKSLNYLVNILAKKYAEKQGAQDALFLNIEGYVTECTTSNIFIVVNKQLHTPAISSGVLDGITRRTVIEIAEEKNIPVYERHIQLYEVLEAEECFLTNTSMEVMPVSFCDGVKIGTGKPGKITQMLQKEFKKYVQKQIEKHERF